MFTKIGRNAPCFCGSGKKYKKCCLNKQQNAVTENNLNLQEEYDDEADDRFDLFEGLLKFSLNIHRRRLSRKPHIKEYRRTRKMHEEITDSMVKYYDKGKFEHKFDKPHLSEQTGVGKKPQELILHEVDYDLDSREGEHAFYDMLFYKCAPNANCITDDFIKSSRYRKPEKIEFLQSMLDSKAGLYEIVKADSEDGYAYIKEVFTGAEYKITDTGLSYSNAGDNHNMYIYMRIITYRDISFNTGLALAFKKTDKFIQDFIKREQKDYKPLGEFVRFIELYNYFTKDSKKVKLMGE